MKLAEKFRGLTPFHRGVLVISGVLAILLGGIGPASWSAARGAQTAAARLQDAQNQMQLLQQTVSKPVPAPDLSLPARKIPSNWEMARFFADLTNAAETWGVQITSVTPNPPTPDPGGFKPPGSNNSGSASVPSPSGNPANPPVSNPRPSGASSAPGGSATGSTTGSAGAGTTAGKAAGQAAAVEGNAGTAKGQEGTPPSALPGVHSLTLTINAEGTGSNLLAFLDELTAMPRLVWIPKYTLDFGQGGGGPASPAGPARLQLTVLLYSHAPWDSRAVAETPWPFPLQPAGNPEAFGP